MRSARQWLPRRGTIALHPQTLLAFEGFQLHPESWLSFDEAMAIADTHDSVDGVGFVLTESDPYFFIDVDDQLDPVTGQWSPLAFKIAQRFAGAYVESSRSGRGFHIYGVAHGIPEHRCKILGFPVELYTRRKFVYWSGINGTGDDALDCTPALLALIAEHFPAPTVVDDGEWTTGPREDWQGIADDSELLATAMRCVSGAAIFADNRAAFGDLWDAREAVLCKAYPDATGANAYDRSTADAALAQHLAFWTGCDCERILSLMWRSGLARDKWREREGYLRQTISRACAMQVQVHQRGGVAPTPAHTVAQPAPTGAQPAPTGAQPPQAPATTAAPNMQPGHQILAVTQQIEHFAGCVYVQSMNRILVPGGLLLDQARFRATYGGFVFALDMGGQKTTKSAWEVFTESQAHRFPKVAEASFRPDLAPGEIHHRNGVSRVNVYYPLTVARKAGDPGRFLDHLRRLLPDDNDRAILLAYMAACVQYPGAKFKWCPLIQGTEGNGKTLFSLVVAEAIGMKYCYFPRANQLDSEFNGWVANKLFIGIEDIYVGENKQQVMETLKPLITGEIQEVRVMQTDGYCTEVCCNFILNSNHKDALRKTGNDRRYAPFFTAQQSKEDIVRDGMAGEYFPDLYAWLKAEGYAIVSEYLHTYDIPDELNPATRCQRAPDTSSTHEAVSASRGSVEQAVLEAVEEGQPGFAGGYISSVALDKLLERMRAQRQIPVNKRRDLLQSIGYVRHPGLPGGRVNAPSDVDGGARPILFVVADTAAAQGTAPAQILHDYLDAQRGRNIFNTHPHRRA